MTREEAIEILTNHTQYKCNGEDLAALNKAINALDQEPCTDVISRQAVLNEIYNTDGISNIYFRLADKIMALPPVTPAEKVGHWITTRTFMHYGEYYCDRCKCDAPNNEKWDYCPSCGAKMQEVIL